MTALGGATYLGPDFLLSLCKKCIEGVNSLLSIV